MNNTTDGSKNQEVIAPISINSKEITVKSIQNLIISLPNRPPAMLAKDLAKTYDTETSHVNRAVDRNIERFPLDFRFQATNEETNVLVCQSVITKESSLKSNPYLFTREGANMLSAVLHSDIAVQRSIQIMRAFSAMESKVIAIKPKEVSRLEMAQLLLLAEQDREAAEKQVKQLETEKRFNAPKVEAWESFLESDGYFTLRGAFKMMGLPPNISTRMLRDEKVLYKLQKTNTPNQKYIDKGYFVVKVNRNEQRDKEFAQTYVTPAGLEWLRGKFNNFVASFKSNQEVTV